MSDKHPEDGRSPETPPESPSGAARRLRDRVDFFEKVWTGTQRSSEDSLSYTDSSIDVEEIERRLLEERRRHGSGTHLEHVTLRHTPLSSPKKIIIHRETIVSPSRSGTFEATASTTPIDVHQLERRLEEERKKFYNTASQLEHVQLRHTSPKHHRTISKDDGEFVETFEKTTEEGDLASGVKMVKFERVTVKKQVREMTLSSRTPSEERILEDSAYHSHGNGVSKSSSITSLTTGRFPSEESLRRTPSKENVKDDWDTASSSSKTTSSEWYNEYKNESFLKSGTKLEYVRSKSQYDTHIAEIRGNLFIYFALQLSTPTPAGSLIA